MTLFKVRDAVAPNVAAIGYTFLGHAAAVILLVHGGAAAGTAGFLLIVHTLLLSGYLMHEAMHETLFHSTAAHSRLGTALSWLNGGGYAGFHALQRKHLHHHYDRIDPVSFDYRKVLQEKPALRSLVLALEWAHLPAVELLLKAEGMLRPFRAAGERRDRARVIGLLAARLGATALLAAASLRALALYLAARLLFVVTLRFFDAFHHTFDMEVVPDYEVAFGAAPGRTRDYEDGHTYSNLLSTRWPRLNVLVLNFTYHNAHHLRPGVAWHRLPEIDRRLCAEPPARQLPVRRLLADFHRFRLERILGTQAVVAPAEPGGRERFVGAVGVSLLTL